MVRLVLFACLVAVSFTVFGMAQAEGADPYSLALVSTTLRLRSGGKQVILARNQKYLSRLGDGVSVALLKLLSDEELTSVATVKNILPVIRESFDQPQSITIAEDRKPNVTLFLLNYLHNRVNDSQSRRDIENTEKFVRERTTE
ncbi:MAG: hypothetical protein ACRD3L_13170 [Terriglobales bacterium]